LPTQALALLAVFVYATHATHATQRCVRYVRLDGNRASVVYPPTSSMAWKREISTPPKLHLEYYDIFTFKYFTQSTSAQENGGRLYTLRRFASSNVSLCISPIRFSPRWTTSRDERCVNVPLDSVDIWLRSRSSFRKFHSPANVSMSMR